MIKARNLHFSTFPVVDDEKLVGLVSKMDVRFQPTDRIVRDIMVPFEDLVLLTKEEISSKGAIDSSRLKGRFIDRYHEHKKKTMPIVDESQRLLGIVCAKDIDLEEEYPSAARDRNGRLIVAAAIGVGEEHLARAEILLKAGVDVLVIDTAHGHSAMVVKMVRDLKRRFPKAKIVAGNIATEKAARDLIAAGADALKVGIGPGSICTTRVVAGVGVPQISAIMAVRRAIDASRRKDVCLIADGGIKYSGDVAKAIAAGADSVMLGSMLAGCSESPSDEVLIDGKRYKEIRGMGSLGAMRSRGGRERYGQADVKDEKKLVPEGIEGRVPFRGPLRDTLYQLSGGLKSSMGYCGTRTIKELRGKRNFILMSPAGLKESHPHDVVITKEAPNYSSR
jgi:IMP dehydrogenase